MEDVKNFYDWLSGFAILGMLASWIPILLATPAAIWYCIRIYEWWKNRKSKCIDTPKNQKSD